MERCSAEHPPLPLSPVMLTWWRIIGSCDPALQSIVAHTTAWVFVFISVRLQKLSIIKKNEAMKKSKTIFFRRLMVLHFNKSQHSANINTEDNKIPNLKIEQRLDSRSQQKYISYQYGRWAPKHCIIVYSRTKGRSVPYCIWHA